MSLNSKNSQSVSIQLQSQRVLREISKWVRNKPVLLQKSFVYQCCWLSRLKVITTNHLNELISQREIYIQIMTCGYYSSDQCNCDRLQNYRGKNLQEIWDTFKFIPFKHDTTSQKNNVPSVYLYNFDKQ